ncbi:MAG: ABC transporter permease [Tissierellia bacterium]|nr:ABC transporter permease [Tissierellia bacterium]
MENKASLYKGRSRYSEMKKRDIKERIYRGLVFVGVIGIWYFGAIRIDSPLLLPTPMAIAKALVSSVTDPEILLNLSITMKRVLKGFLYALLAGIPIGYIMGLSELAEKLLGGIIDSVRQVPIMAWVPLTIIWLGIGDGPTLFMIALSGVFPIILNTMQGVRGISKDYYNAARSMGAGPLSIFVNVIIPASIPDVLTGARIAVGTGWMSVV